MIKTRLAAVLSLAFLAVTNANSAQYRVVELPLAEKGKSIFPSAINDDGEVTVNVTTPYNAPIDTSLLDFELDTFIEGLTDLDAAKTGNFNIVDYTNVLSVIVGNRGSQIYQQIASNTSFLANDSQSTFIPGFGEKNLSNEYMWDTNTLVRGINDAGHVTGRSQDGFYKLPYTFSEVISDDGTVIAPEVETTFILNDFSSRGFVVVNGVTKELPPTDLMLGGVSDALGINNSNQVVGLGTTLFESDVIQDSYDACIDNEEVDGVIPRGDLPVESCISSIFNEYAPNFSTRGLWQLDDAESPYAQVRGLIWQLDDDGNVIETKELGMLFTPEADDERKYSSWASAINDNGIAVGQAPGEYVGGENTAIRNFAVVYSGDDVINITPNVDINIAVSNSTLSKANDINNNDLVIGYQPKSINGSFRTKFFVYDVNSAELIFPEDFFIGSSSVALDINNNNQVVGYGEIESTQTTRRIGGFIYDHSSQEFSGLNELIACDSPYTIVQANAINDNGVIAATALVEAPARNARGEIFLNDAGEQINQEHIVAVKLEPIAGGTNDECEVPETDINRERQGASVYWLMPFSFLLLAFRRRRTKTN